MRLAELTRLRLGLIGHGPFAQHLARMELNTTADIALMWTHSKATAGRIIADEFNATADVDELIGNPKVEAVVVASPNVTHKEYCLKTCAAKHAYPFGLQMAIMLKSIVHGMSHFCTTQTGVTLFADYRYLRGVPSMTLGEWADWEFSHSAL